MGIKITNIYAKICEPANLYRAAHNTLLKGLRYKPQGAAWKKNMEYHLYKLHYQLKNKTYKHGSYSVFKVYDPKERVILAAQLTDRVVHHALHDIIEPIIDRKFIDHSYACRVGKGHHLGVKTAQKFLRKYDYFIHLDVKKFFYSIHRPTLLAIIRRTIKDEEVDYLIAEILDSSTRHAFYPSKEQTAQFDLFHQEIDSVPTTPTQTRALPIGNLCSQLFANWYLNELDQFVKHQLKHKAYLRYMDDFVLFSNDKNQLRLLENCITEFCDSTLKLRLHASGGAKKYINGLSFLGFRIFRNHIRVKSASVKRFRKKLANEIEHTNHRQMDGFKGLYAKTQAWNAHVKHADSYGLRNSVFGKYAVTNYMHGKNFNYKELMKPLLWIN